MVLCGFLYFSTFYQYLDSLVPTLGTHKSGLQLITDTQCPNLISKLISCRGHKENITQYWCVLTIAIWPSHVFINICNVITHSMYEPQKNYVVINNTDNGQFESSIHNPYHAETELISFIIFNIMAADSLALCFAMLSAGMILTT